ncbi:MAG: hypothetical protein RI885_39 [Actinomycetota bacterium]|jgi:hypothetical protein
MTQLTLPWFVVPGADFPPWAPVVFGLIGLATLGVLVWQAVRYFRDNPGDDDGRDDR